MDARYFPILIILLLLLIGFIQVRSHYQDLKKRRDFVNEFINKFSEFATAASFDNQLYFWLTQNSVAMQSELGPFGIVDYKPPAASYMIQNYPVIVNFLPELRRERTDRMFQDYGMYQEYVNVYLDVLVRYSGVIERQLKQAANEIRNPLIWLRNGVQTVLLIPLYVFQGFGILGASTIGKFTMNILVKSISSLLGIVGLLSSLVTIIVGWDQSRNFLLSLWQMISRP